MKRIILTAQALLVVFFLWAQDASVIQYGKMVSPAELKDYLTILASDALEGRGTGTRGQKMAAAFIAHHFESQGLTGPVNGSYYQPITLYSAGNPSSSLSVAGTPLKEGEDFFFFGSMDTGGLVQSSLIYAGKGTETDLRAVDVKGKAAVVLLESNASLRNNAQISNVRNAGATMVFAVMEKEEDFRTTVNQMRMFAGGRMSLNRPSGTSGTGLFLLTPGAAAQLFKTSPEKLLKAAAEKSFSKMKPVTAGYTVTSQVREIKTENVLGFLEGTDKKDEVLVITAHYDHIGRRSSGEGDLINNGADDDGSGTSAVMALAKAFAQAKKDGKGPRRSILFMTVTAEEIGLLGSEYYADRNPILPLQQTVVNLNIDMIGRRDPQHNGSDPYVYVIGSDKLSSELHRLSESVNKKYTNLVFDYTYNDPNHPERLYYRSDHWNFAKKSIPIIFYFDGIHEDYHKPSDEVDKIEFELMALRAQCIFYTAWEIANRDARITPDTN
jgi:hypothetical protein